MLLELDFENNVKKLNFTWTGEEHSLAYEMLTESDLKIIQRADESEYIHDHLAAAAIIARRCHEYHAREGHLAAIRRIAELN